MCWIFCYDIWNLHICAVFIFFHVCSYVRRASLPHLKFLVNSTTEPTIKPPPAPSPCRLSPEIPRAHKWQISPLPALVVWAARTGLRASPVANLSPPRAHACSATIESLSPPHGWTCASAVVPLSRWTFKQHASAYGLADRHPSRAHRSISRVCTQARPPSSLCRPCLAGRARPLEPRALVSIAWSSFRAGHVPIESPPRCAHFVYFFPVFISMQPLLMWKILHVGEEEQQPPPNATHALLIYVSCSAAPNLFLCWIGWLTPGPDMTMYSALL
jgi:hypothetical protein